MITKGDRSVLRARTPVDVSVGSKTGQPARDPLRPGRLWLIPNVLDQAKPGPEGRLRDLRELLPLQVLEVASQLTHWVAETPKVARQFLKRVDGVVPLRVPLQEQSIAEMPRARKGGSAAEPEAARVRTCLEALWAGEDVGLISDAGLPAVADPGAGLVEAAHAGGARVCPLAGPSSLMMALAASGLNGQSFAFVGYLPVEAGPRAERLRELEVHSARWRQTQIIIETPYRNASLFRSLLDRLRPDTRLTVACGLSLADETVYTREVAHWRKDCARSPQSEDPTHWPPDDLPAVFLFLAR